MEEKGYFEFMKKNMIEREEERKKNNHKGANGQTPDNVLENIDEYTLKELIIMANTMAHHAQLVSDGKMTISQFEEHYTIEYFERYGFKTVLNYIRKNEKTMSEISEKVREYFLMYAQIPVHLTGMIYRKQDLEQAQQEYDKIYKLALENRDNYDIRKAEIDALYKLRYIRELYSPSNVAGNNPVNSNSIRKEMLEAVAKLDAEFTQTDQKTR